MTAIAGRAGQAAFALLLCIVGAVVAVRSAQYGLVTEGRMGPGAYPGLLGVLLAALGGWVALQSVRALRRPGTDTDAAAEEAREEWSSPRKAFVVLAILAIAVAAAPLVGLIPALTAVIFVLALVIERCGLVTSAVLAVVCFALYYGIFEVLLAVPMPGPF